VVEALRRFVKDPYPTAFLFEGWTGTGKTSAALALLRFAMPFLACQTRRLRGRIERSQSSRSPTW
jgi:DNA polymerase III delta prime subunit